MSGNAPSLTKQGRIWPFLLWLAVFYTAWSLIVFVGGHWEQVKAHWPIAAAMAAGSYVAGSTPMGGGTVGFPILVLLFKQPADLGRNFSFAVQSIGMTSASIFIIFQRRRVDWRFLGWVALAALIVTPISSIWLAPHVSGLFTKLLFAVLWCSFGIVHLLRLRQVVGMKELGAERTPFGLACALSVGLLGGVIASITGVGIDMLLYAALVVLFRTDLKVAIPTSVIIMSFTSLVGVATNGALGRLQPEVFYNWMAAAPIVALGAPLGAFIVQVVRRGPTLVFVSILCVGQFVWTIVDQRVAGLTLVLTLIGLAAFLFLFHLMSVWGDRRRIDAFEAGYARTHPAPTPPIADSTAAASTPST